MSKVSDELYQRLHGFRAIKREEIKENQSAWYYLDLRYNEGDKRREIDVETENTINPLLKEVLAYDVNKNPDEYYIWRTVGDDKVRSSHAEHEGYAFNWHIAPNTGHPGEDYNCRCSAISYSPKKHKILHVDLRGLKIGNDEDKLIIIITQADITKAFLKSLENEEEKNIISDEQLFEQIWKNIKRFEDIKYYPYLDSKCNITIAGGINVNNWNDFKTLKLTINKVPATILQKKEGFDRLQEFSKELGGKENKFKAEYFEKITNLRISEKEARRLSEIHIKDDLAFLRKEFSDFDDFPMELKEILLDMKYNIREFNQKNWPNLYHAVKTHDVKGIIENVHRRDIQKERNDWAEKLAQSIRF